jgi:membrane protein DedA with SNARE-associated domain
MLAPTLNANSPHSRHRGAHDGTQHAALDLPPRWIGLYPARTARRLRDSASGKHFYRIFGRWGFGAIAVAALLPPPTPMVPFVFVAGAMQYSVKKFLVALTLGRIVRYSLLAYLAAHYGRQVLTVITQHAHPVVIAVVALIAAGMAVLLFFLVRKRKKRTHS